MVNEYAVSEIIGVIALIGIIVASFGIFAAIYIPMIKPNSIPQLKISMACSNFLDEGDIEYPCSQGSHHCDPINPFDNKTCEKDCTYQAYSQNPQFRSEDLQREIYRCMEHCTSPMCSHLDDCRFLYICHNGGDSLDPEKMSILINGNNIERSEWKLKKPASVMAESTFSPGLNESFSIGSSLRILNHFNPVDSVMIVYNPPSGGSITLALNQFGTDITI
jgi:hypothetical protein